MDRIKEPGEYRPTIPDVRKWCGVLNEVIFDGVAPKFRDVRIKTISGQHAHCCPYLYHEHKEDEERYCKLAINETFHSFKFFITILAHEIIHAIEWKEGIPLSHGKSFFKWKSKFKEHSIPLHRKYRVPKRKVLTT